LSRFFSFPSSLPFLSRHNTSPLPFVMSNWFIQDIFVHGNCVTIGCLPITDDGIKQVYWLAVLARQSGQRHIPIWIFPARLTNEEFRALAQAHRGDNELVAFWGNLKQGFDFFEKDHRPPVISVTREGFYHFAP
jgi:murein L,D-transpeptidase YafK